MLGEELDNPDGYRELLGFRVNGWDRQSRTKPRRHEEIGFPENSKGFPNYPGTPKLVAENFRLPSIGSSCLVGSAPMNFRLFESFREWAPLARRRKDSKKPFRDINLEGARVSWDGGGHPNSTPGEIILCLEPPVGEFITKQRSPGVSWLNIKQLTEPSLQAASSPLQERYMP